MAETAYATLFGYIRSRAGGREQDIADSWNNYTPKQRRVLTMISAHRRTPTTGTGTETDFATCLTAVALQTDGWEDTISKSAFRFDDRQFEILENILWRSGYPNLVAEATILLGIGATTFVVPANTRGIYVNGDSGGNTIATITGGISGMEIILHFADANVTITDTAAATANTINLSAAFVSSANDTLSLYFSAFDGGKWFETARAVN